MKLLLALLFTFSFNAMAKPKHFEVWFLSVDTVSWLEQVLPKTKYSKQIATNLQCQQMGEYCFDPQVGLYKKGEESKHIDEAAAYDSIDKQENYDNIDSASSNFIRY